MIPLLAIAAFICAVIGAVQLVKGNFVAGVIWLVVACAIGPGGWAIWR